MIRFMNEEPSLYKTMEEVNKLIVDKILTEDCKPTLFRYSADNKFDSDLNLTFG